MESEDEIVIRPWKATDSYDRLTRLLHLAYKKQADRGFNYLASRQSPDITKQRIQKGKCLVAVRNEMYVATITYYAPSQVSGSKWYNLNDVASYGQFAVHPINQAQGLGSKMIQMVEAMAKEDRAVEIAVDTAVSANDLISFYKNRDYREVERVQWKETNYQSVVLSKTLV